MKNMKRIGWVGHGRGDLSRWIWPTKKRVLESWDKAVKVYIDPKDLRGKK